MGEADRLLEAPQIEGAGLMQGKSGDKIWVLNGEKAQEILRARGVEIGKIYELSGRNGKIKVKIDGISDDRFGFGESSTKNHLMGLRENRAAVWCTIIGESGTGFLGYMKQFAVRQSGAKGFIIGTGKDKMIFDEADTSEVAEVGKDTLSSVLDLL